MTGVFDIIVLLVLGLFGFLGLKNGLVDELATLIGFILAITISAEYYSVGNSMVQSLFRVNDSFGAVLGFIVVFLAIYLICRVIAWGLQNFIKMIKLEWLNKVSGLIFGALKGFFIMASVVWIISVFNDFDLENRLSRQSVSYGILQNFTNDTAQFLGYDDDLARMRDSIRQLFGLDTIQL